MFTYKHILLLITQSLCIQQSTTSVCVNLKLNNLTLYNIFISSCKIREWLDTRILHVHT